MINKIKLIVLGLILISLCIGAKSNKGGGDEDNKGGYDIGMCCISFGGPQHRVIHYEEPMPEGY